MDSDSFTQKSSEAILSARDIAAQRNHQYVEPMYLLAGLLAQTDGLLYPLLAKLGVHTTEVRGPLDGALDAIPIVVGAGEIAFSRRPQQTPTPHWSSTGVISRGRRRRPGHSSRLSYL